VDFDVDHNCNKTAYLYFEFYNGAISTDQCSRLIGAMAYIISESTAESPVRAVALMGGSYFSNGIALNVIEAAKDPAEESWLNINRIDDVVHYILHEFPARGILTIAAIRGNAAAGGVALAAACDVTIAGSEVVLNPAYRAIGLSGSEYHSLTYFARCGKANATKILRSMTPMSPLQAQRMGLIDYIFPGTGEQLEDYIRSHISMLLEPRCLRYGIWKAKVDLSSSALARARATELSEMSKDFWSARSVRYHGRRFDFVRKVKPVTTPLRFAKHRRLFDESRLDIEETDEFDDVEYFRRSAEEQLLACLRDEMRDEMSTPRNMSAISLTGQLPIAVDFCRARKETLFGCYYNPMDDMLTPPETPLETPMDSQMVISRSFFGGLEARLKGY
jgi:enoyl-CoA hydratase/carnithine racemase